MACSCNRPAVPPTGSAAARAAADRASAEAKAHAAARAANPSINRIGPPVSGQSQSFTLNVGGQVQTFGSRLERDAAAVRLNRR